MPVCHAAYRYANLRALPFITNTMIIHKLRFALVLLLMLLSQSSFAQENKTAAPDRRITITIDDLPWAGGNDQIWEDKNSATSRSIKQHHQRLIKAMKKARAPVVGFVNEGKLYSGDLLQKNRIAMLNDWLNSGFELGNHTYGHVSMHDVTLPAYEENILKGELHLRPMLAKHGQSPQWFRHPYLRAGRTLEDKTALQKFLAEHGYRIAPVTIDNGEWVYAFAYRNVLAKDGDKETLARLRRDYVPYMIAKVDFYEQASINLLGYNLPQILLIHANELNAETYADLVAGIRGRGYRFVTLEESMRDPAYLRADTFTGRFGPSWLHRWALAEKRPKAFYEGEPVVPQWVLDLAEVESE
jgi:peptidoglycan/xylan/chitin deacetylase (PgdA/CDA1 family)